MDTLIQNKLLRPMFYKNNTLTFCRNFIQIGFMLISFIKKQFLSYQNIIIFEHEKASIFCL